MKKKETRIQEIERKIRNAKRCFQRQYNKEMISGILSVRTSSSFWDQAIRDYNKELDEEKAKLEV